MKNSTIEQIKSKSDVISASEIGQYVYCSVAWHLKRMGYEPESPKLEQGIEKHRKIGFKIDKIETKNRKSNIIAIAGYTILILTLLLIIYELII